MNKSKLPLFCVLRAGLRKEIRRWGTVLGCVRPIRQKKAWRSGSLFLYTRSSKSWPRALQRTGPAFFRCRDFRDANLYMIFHCRVHVAVCFTAPGEASAIFKPHGALYMSFSGARIGMDDPRLFSAFCKLRKDRPAFSDTRVSFLRFPWRTESIPPRRGGSLPAPPRGSRAPCNAPVALRPTTQPGNIP